MENEKELESNSFANLLTSDSDDEEEGDNKIPGKSRSAKAVSSLEREIASNQNPHDTISARPEAIKRRGTCFHHR